MNNKINNKQNKILTSVSAKSRPCRSQGEDWRLVEFISKVEAYQGRLGFGKIKDSDKIAQCRAEEKINYRNRVSIKRYNLIDPLKADYGMAGRTINEAYMENTKTIATPPWLIHNRRFPISAHFLASWISENVRSSKSYRLVFLFEKMAKELFDSTIEDKKIVLSHALLSNPELTGRLATRRNLLAEDTLNSINLNTPSKTLLDSVKPSLKLNKNNTENTRIIKQKLIGLKIIISGRILGAEMARIQRFKRGQTPGNTLSVIKDKAQVTAKTKTGTLGIKLTTYWR